MTRSLDSLTTELGLGVRDWLPVGRDEAKIDPAVIGRARESARLVLVTAITPTRAGEGKTTVAIGLADALRRLGASACVALREPSLGPCLGGKGGATGGGASRLHPATDINLHFTGDFHAITTANNLLVSLVDHHLWTGNSLEIDPERVLVRRVTDLEDRTLRAVVTGLGGRSNGVPRETGFDITPASEVMAILCLAESLDDLRARLERMVVAFTGDGRPVTAVELSATGAMLALLTDALWPNLVQTLEGTPAFVHGGPFANIAHGCSSLLATRMGLALTDWVVTEAGFGSDLGAEKFFDIKCRAGGLAPAAVVLVATVRALELHGGAPPDALEHAHVDALRRGLPNLARHLEIVRSFGQRPVVALNRFATDTDEEVEVVHAFCVEHGVPCATTTHFVHGGRGALELAETVQRVAAPGSTPVRFPYASSAPLASKIEAVAREIYGARGVTFAPAARRELRRLEDRGFGELPVCIAKTERSLSDDPALGGLPQDFELHVERVFPQAGAGFVVALAGRVLRMPGLPREPRVGGIDVVDGRITGVD